MKWTIGSSLSGSRPTNKTKNPTLTWIRVFSWNQIHQWNVGSFGKMYSLYQVFFAFYIIYFINYKYLFYFYFVLFFPESVHTFMYHLGVLCGICRKTSEYPLNNLPHTLVSSCWFGLVFLWGTFSCICYKFGTVFRVWSLLYLNVVIYL